ncbi:MAG: MOSC domain-containing protein [Candidatus Omnitrophota bacterium]
MTGKVFSINIGKEKGKPKDMVKSAVFKEGYGIEGDVHAAGGGRQVSLLSIEEIEKVEMAGSASRDIDFRPGIFAENITTEGIDLSKLKIGASLQVGESVVLKVTQIGKECVSGCHIMQHVGRCIMPKQGVFASVENGGTVNLHDNITLSRQKVLFPWLKT